MNPKRAFQLAIRQMHKTFLFRNTPKKVGLYFHELEEHQYSGFSDCIEYWMSEDYRPVDASEFVESDDDKLLFVSFDDNFRSWHAALPLFDSLNLTATFYVNTLPMRDTATDAQVAEFFDRIHHKGERIAMSRDELRELAAAGHTIGCHSHSHFDLGSIEEEKAKSEILMCKERLEEILQCGVTDFSFPFGMRRNFTESLRDFCLQNGFRTVSNAIPGRLHEAPTHRFLNRTPWDLSQPLNYNVANIRIDGRMFESLTGRSAVV